jgi:hypothetical protein
VYILMSLTAIGLFAAAGYWPDLPEWRRATLAQAGVTSLIFAQLWDQMHEIRRLRKKVEGR